MQWSSTILKGKDSLNRQNLDVSMKIKLTLSLDKANLAEVKSSATTGTTPAVVAL